jgi:hypothetical protein
MKPKWKLTVVIFNDAIEENTCHRYGTAREVRIIVHTLSNLNASGGVNVTSQKGEQIVLYNLRPSVLYVEGIYATHSTTMASFDNQAQVRGEGSSVSSPSGLLIGVWRWHVIRELSGALEHFALSVRPVGILNLLCHCPRLVSGVRDTDKVTPCDAVQRMASSAYLTVNLISSSDTARNREWRLYKVCADIPSVIKRIQNSTMRPGVSSRMKTFITEMSGMDFA